LEAGGALACWFKPVAVTQLAFVAAVAAFTAARAAPGTRLRLLGLSGAGIALGTAAVCAVFAGWLAAIGAWQAFVDAVVLHNFQYARSTPLLAASEPLRKRFDEQWPAFGVLWALAAVSLLWPGLVAVRARVLLLGWAVASAVGVAVGLYFRPHYFFQTLPPLVGLAAFALAGATAPTLRRSSIGPTLGVALACAAVAIVPPLAADAPIRAAGSPGDISRAIYGTNPFVESEAIGDYIRRTSDTDDRVYVVGSEPQILFHARRVSATRYIFLYPLTGDYSDARERQRELVKEVKAAKPLYVVWTNIPTSLLLDVRSETYVLAHARAMLDRDYRLELVAYPMSSEGRFDFAYGMNARRIMKEAGERSRSAQWIGVYRRKDAAPSTR